MTERPIEAYKLDDIYKFANITAQGVADIETDIETAQSYYDGYIAGMNAIVKFMDEWKG